MLSSRDFLYELGRISYYFQLIEGAFYLLANCLISSDHKIGQILLSRLSFSHLCTVLVNLFRYQVADKKVVDELEEIIKAASDLEESRNSIIHSVYLPSEDESQHIVTRFKVILKRTGIKTHSHEMDAADIRVVADQMAELFERILQFLGMVDEQGLVAFPEVTSQ